MTYTIYVVYAVDINDNELLYDVSLDEETAIELSESAVEDLDYAEKSFVKKFTVTKEQIEIIEGLFGV